MFSSDLISPPQTRPSTPSPNSQSSETSLLSQLFPHLPSHPSAPSDVSSYFTANLSEVLARHKKWMAAFPTITKSFNTSSVRDVFLRDVLRGLGCEFVSPLPEEGCTLDNPCLSRAILRTAGRRNVRRVVASSVQDLERISQFCPSVQVMLSAEMLQMSSLIRRTKELALTLIGFKGVNVQELVSNFNAAVAAGSDPRIIHLTDLTLNSAETVKRTKIPRFAELHADISGYLTQDILTLHTRVAEVKLGQISIHDSVFDSFSQDLFNHEHQSPVALDLGQSRREFCVRGHTRDIHDVICSKVSLPDLKVGDWLQWRDMRGTGNGITPMSVSWYIRPFEFEK